MDPRQQHPFSRNTATPYSRNPFPANSNQQPYPPSAHPPNPNSNSNTSFSDHQRRPSDPPYSNYPPRQYSGDGTPIPGGGHSRHQSASSIGHGTPVSRGMPPPSSPQQREPHGYGPSRVPAAGPPTSFTSGRELPALPPGRPASTAGGSMSIHSILGGPSPASREPPPHYASPVTTAGPQSSTYSNASPRMTSAPDYASYRRPLTPEQRSYEPRDHRANSAGSPPGQYNTPEAARRFGTPQAYGQRSMQQEDRREPIRVPNPNNPAPPRPSSQPGPSAYSAPPRPSEPRAPIHGDGIFGRRDPARSDSINREPPFQRNEYEERQPSGYAYAERARQQEREIALHGEREREQRERSEHLNRVQQDYAHQLAQRNAQAYSRVPEREPPSWMSRTYEPPRPAYEPIPEQAPHQREPLPGQEYPRTTAPQYPSHSAYSSNEDRYTAAQPAAVQAHQTSTPSSQYEAEIQERLRMVQYQAEQRQAMYRQPQNAPYQSQDSPTKRPLEDTQQMQQQVQRNYLGVQEMNRKGRVSPLPQAVQGAQGQIGGPGGTPGIKSEFGRMFSGIGSGVGAMGVSSPIIGGQQSLPHSGQFRREDLDGMQDSPIENGGYKLARSPSRADRRRKLKDEDGRDDDSSTGRRTPSGSGRVKRPKTTSHHHHGPRHHHHHRADALENTSSPSQSNLTPFRNINGAAIPSPPESKSAPVLHHHHVPRHHHHPAASVKAVIQPPRIVPLPKTKIRSQEVLDAVANLPRKHLGHAYYQPHLKAAGVSSRGPRSKIGFASTPEPLPRFEGHENSTFTIKVSRIHMSAISREEITYRKALWGTDVYTDDSDAIAACIHQGWFRGAWGPGVDTKHLDLVLKPGPVPPAKDFLTFPPPNGPMEVPTDKDLHITLLILPVLEKYSSTTRFGIKSREWGEKRDGYKGKHDGLSFMIKSIRWVDGVDATVLKSSSERKKMIVQNAEAALDEEESWSKLFNGNGQQNGDGASIPESFERGGKGPLSGGFKGVGTGSWWKESALAGKSKEKVNIEKEKASEKEPETGNNDSSKERVIEEVTERMIENANVQAGPVDMESEKGKGIVT